MIWDKTFEFDGDYSKAKFYYMQCSTRLFLASQAAYGLMISNPMLADSSIGRDTIAESSLDFADTLIALDKLDKLKLNKIKAFKASMKKVKPTSFYGKQHRNNSSKS